MRCDFDAGYTKESSQKVRLFDRQNVWIVDNSAKNGFYIIKTEEFSSQNVDSAFKSVFRHATDEIEVGYYVVTGSSIISIAKTPLTALFDFHKNRSKSVMSSLGFLHVNSDSDLLYFFYPDETVEFHRDLKEPTKLNFDIFPPGPRDMTASFVFKLSDDSGYRVILLKKNWKICNFTINSSLFEKNVTEFVC